MLGSDLLALVITLVAALAWLRVNDFLAHRGIISSALSRKIIHIGTGPIFVLCWLLFTSAPSARFVAAIVPLGITLQFFMVGAGIIKDKAAVDAMARNGDRREILRGPLYYGIVFVVLTVTFWLDSPVGIIALMVLCGGDGFGDVIGKRITSLALPWSPRKTWAGSLAVLVGGFVFSLLVLAVFIQFGIFDLRLGELLPRLLLISVVCAAVESLPVRDLDNLTVPVTAVALGLLLF
ncbi:MAG: phosphatidate cytidylyltransferase [Chloroflexi bacterium]|nr:MAG: phosphatidate cytidylyltransferase [Chloroflexota bacterium]